MQHWLLVCAYFYSKNLLINQYSNQGSQTRPKTSANLKNVYHINEFWHAFPQINKDNVVGYAFKILHSD